MFFNKAKNNYFIAITNYLNNNPSLIILIGLLFVIIPLVVFSFESIILLIILIILGTTTAFVITNWMIAFKMFFWSLLIICIIYFESIYTNNYSTLIQENSSNAQIKAIVIDPEVVDGNIKWLPHPKYIKMDVKYIRLGSDEKWIESSGIVNVKINSRQWNLMKKSSRFSWKTDKIITQDQLIPDINHKTVCYGEYLQLNGTFKEPFDAAFIGGFSYKNYLKSININKIFIADNYHSLGYSGFPFNLYRQAYSLRDYFINKLTYGIKSTNTKAFLAAFFFGCRQGINKNLKQIFIRSGTIHILAISGLHVGILALILLMLVRWLPITPRYVIIPLFLFVYIFLTGFQPSGLRAFIMISIICFHKAFFFSIRPINTIALAAVIVLFFNPFSIMNIGFQFSFIVTGFLILSWDKINKCIRIVFEKNEWLVSREILYFKRMRLYLQKKLLLIVLTSIVAGVSSMGLSLYYQSLFTPVMIILNIIILPLLMPLFILGGLKIILSIFFSMSLYYLNIIIGGLISFIYFMAESGSSQLLIRYCQQPSVYILIIFYLILTAIFIAVKKKYILVNFVLLVILLLSVLYINIFPKSKIIVIKGADSVPVIAVIVPNSYLKPTVINCPRETSSVLLDKLKKGGINSLGSVIITSLTKKYNAGLPYLLSQIKVDNLIYVSKYRKTKLYRTIKSICSEQQINIIDKSKLKNNQSIESNINIYSNISWKPGKHVDYFQWNTYNDDLYIRFITSLPDIAGLEVERNKIFIGDMKYNTNNFIQVKELFL